MYRPGRTTYTASAHDPVQRVTLHGRVVLPLELLVKSNEKRVLVKNGIAERGVDRDPVRLEDLPCLQDLLIVPPEAADNRDAGHGVSLPPQLATNGASYCLRAEPAKLNLVNWR